MQIRAALVVHAIALASACAAEPSSADEASSSSSPPPEGSSSEPATGSPTAGDTTTGAGETSTSSDAGESTSGTPASCELLPPVWYDAGARELAVLDLDGDGDLDVAAVDGGLRLFENAGGGDLDGPSAPPPSFPGSAIAVSDFDEDGASDFAIASVIFEHSELTVMLREPPATLSQVDVYPIDGEPFALRAGDLDGDGHIDVVGADANGDRVLVWHGDGTGALSPGADVLAQGSPTDVAIADFDADGDPDLAYSEGDSIGVAINDGAGGFEFDTSFAVEQYGASGIAAADFDGDGDIDITCAMRNYDEPYRPGPRLALLRNVGDATFAAPESFEAGRDPWSPTAVDLNADGALDLAVSDAADSTTVALINQGDGTFATPIVYHTGALGPIVVGDMNDDGYADLVLGDRYDERVGVMLNACTR